MSEPKLLHCPFCGAEAKMEHDEYREAPDCGGERDESLDAWYVRCTGCNLVPNGWGNIDWSSEESAAAAWNRRPVTDGEAGVIHLEMYCTPPPTACRQVRKDNDLLATAINLVTCEDCRQVWKLDKQRRPVNEADDQGDV